jgi:hypothetical protein
MLFGEDTRSGAHGGAPNGSEFVMQMGMQYGQRMWVESERSVTKWLPTAELRKRFHVSHAYVRSKLAMLAVPYIKNFERKQCDFGDGGSSVEFYAPVDDVCAPDLYIPAMGIITYVTLFAFALGLGSGRSVESQDLGATATFAVVSIVLQAFAVNIWRYASGLVTTSFLDLFAVFGYAYVSVSFAVLLGMLGLSTTVWAWRFVVILLAANFATFLYRSLRELFAKDGTVPKRALPIIYGCCICQLPLFLLTAARPF